MSASPDPTSHIKQLQELLRDKFELPHDSEFVSQAPAGSAELVLKMSLNALPAVNSRPDFVQWKLSRPFIEPFSL